MSSLAVLLKVKRQITGPSPPQFCHTAPPRNSDPRVDSHSIFKVIRAETNGRGHRKSLQEPSGSAVVQWSFQRTVTFSWSPIHQHLSSARGHDEIKIHKGLSIIRAPGLTLRHVFTAKHWLQKHEEGQRFATTPRLSFRDYARPPWCH